MKNVIPTFLMALAIVLSTVILSQTYRNRNQASNSIRVTGLGSKNFVSDLIVWSGSFSRKNMTLKEAYAELDRDRAIISDYLKGKGVKTDELIFSAVDINKEYDVQYDNNGNQTRSVFNGYRLRQNVQIESTEVDKIESISRQVTELINTGVEFSSSAPQYFYTKLSELKIEMIAEATRDAHTRASQIAENAGSSVGKLKNADMGVFQITAQNSSEEYSWGGSFNTWSKRKTAAITVKLEYMVE